MCGEFVKVFTSCLDGDPVLAQDQGWRLDAACVGYETDLFFPAGETGPAVEQIEAAKAVCRECPVQAQCLAFAIVTNQEFGVWGGTTEQERRKLRTVWLAHRPSLQQRSLRPQPDSPALALAPSVGAHRSLNQTEARGRDRC